MLVQQDFTRHPGKQPRGHARHRRGFVPCLRRCHGCDPEALLVSTCKCAPCSRRAQQHNAFVGTRCSPSTVRPIIDQQRRSTVTDTARVQWKCNTRARHATQRGGAHCDANHRGTTNWQPAHVHTQQRRATTPTHSPRRQSRGACCTHCHACCTQPPCSPRAGPWHSLDAARARGVQAKPPFDRAVCVGS